MDIDQSKQPNVLSFNFPFNFPFLTQRWFEWWCSFPSAEPTTGQMVDGIFFLTTKKMERNDSSILQTKNDLCSSMPVLFPVDKWFSLGFPFITPDDELKRIATERINQLPNISVKLDGQTLKPTRVQSPVFTLKLARDIPNPETGQTKKIVKGKYKCVVEGYWVFLKSLEKGVHVIPSFASCSTGVLSLDVRHTLKVH